MIYNDSSVRIAAITDGTSNTFIFGEQSKGHLFILDPGYAVSDSSWNSGRWYDTLFSTLYPMNLAMGNSACRRRYSAGYYSPTAAGSYHPGGANFALLRRLGPVHQELDQLLVVQRGECRQLRGCHAQRHGLHGVSATAPCIKTGYYLANTGTARRLPAALDARRRRGDQLRFVLIDSRPARAAAPSPTHFDAPGRARRPCPGLRSVPVISRFPPERLMTIGSRGIRSCPRSREPLAWSSSAS